MFEGFVPDDERFAWLSNHASGWQFGEQGILFMLASCISPVGQCVEIGAGDGEYLPLTIDPFYQDGADCVLFESDLVKLGKLRVKYPRANLRGEFGGTMCGVSKNPLVVVIDIDGYDIDAMRECLTQCTPGVLMVEHFDRCHPEDCDEVADIPSWALGLELKGNFTLQANAATIRNAAYEFEYHRIGTTRVNSIFVHKDHLPKVSNHVPS
jgi:ribosomal protein S27AE